jgi:hypothetical protein
MTKVLESTLKRVDVRLLARRGVLNGSEALSMTWRKPSASSISAMRKGSEISLSLSSENLSEKTYFVSLETTPCYFGGFRNWFLCPGCSRRVAILYSTDSFSCRKCTNATYASKNINRRSPFYSYLVALMLDEKISALLPSVRREQYAGLPTKKSLLLIRLQKRYMAYVFSLSV